MTETSNGVAIFWVVAAFFFAASAGYSYARMGTVGTQAGTGLALAVAAVAMAWRYDRRLDNQHPNS